MRKLFALLGDPVAHSRSPAMYSRAFALLGADAAYLPCRVAAADLPAAVLGLRVLGAAGFNATVPHKGELLRLCDQLAPAAERIGAVNCVVREGDTFIGHNTDAPGLLRALRVAGVDATGARAVVLGAGGSARAAALALADRVQSLVVINRTESKARSLASSAHAAGCAFAEGCASGSEAATRALAQATLVIHCTTIGLGSLQLPFDPAQLAPGVTLVDLVYAPGGETALLQAARARGLRTVDGIEVLVQQGILSLQLWFNRPQLDELRAPLREAALAAAG